jgi:L-serine/L-threonine ammonia-lyase
MFKVIRKIIQNELVPLPAITSIAKSLGSKKICEAAFNWRKKHNVIPVVVTDDMAVNACKRFLDDMRCLVEPACGAGLDLLTLVSSS